MKWCSVSQIWSKPSSSVHCICSRARRIAGTLGSEVVLVHVFPEPPVYGEPSLLVGKDRDVYEKARQWVAEELEGGRGQAEWGHRAHGRAHGHGLPGDRRSRDR